LLSPSELIISERIKELRDELIQAVRGLFGELTAHQQEVLGLWLRGRTQNEIAEDLGICQASVCKCLWGNDSTSCGGKRYGGVLKRLRTLAAADPEVQRLLAELAALAD
jgi:hypothetical protein